MSDVFRLGDQPFANAFLEPRQLLEPETTCPLVIHECDDCGQVQLSHVVDATELYRHYSFETGSSRRMAEHFAHLMAVNIERYVERGGLVIEIGSNDGTALASIQRTDVRCLGIDPAENLATNATHRGIRTVTAFFDEATARRVANEHGSADLIVACNVLGHVDDLDGFCCGIQVLLAQRGTLVVEVPHVNWLVRRAEFDTIYHEHLSYFSVRPLRRLFERHGLHVTNVTEQDVHGGSMRLTIRREPSLELSLLCRIEQWRRDWGKFQEQCESRRSRLVRWLEKQRDLGRLVWGYGAPAKGTVLLNYCGVGCDLLPVVVDSTPSKQGKHVPGTHQPIVAPSELLQQQPASALVLAWNHFLEIVAKESQYLARGGRLVTAGNSVDRQNRRNYPLRVG